MIAQSTEMHAFLALQSLQIVIQRETTHYYLTFMETVKQTVWNVSFTYYKWVV